MVMSARCVPAPAQCCRGIGPLLLVCASPAARVTLDSHFLLMAPGQDPDAPLPWELSEGWWVAALGEGWFLGHDPLSWRRCDVEK